MHNSVVPYDVCEALQKIGFDEGCMFYRDKDDKNTVFVVHQSGHTTHINFVKNSNIQRSFKTGKPVCVAAPIYDQAVQWLNDVHGVYVEVHRSYWKYNLDRDCNECETRYAVEYNEYVYTQNNNDCLNDTLGNEFPTYYEAMNNALLVAIKKIKTKKHKLPVDEYKNTEVDKFLFRLYKRSANVNLKMKDAVLGDDTLIVNECPTIIQTEKAGALIDLGVLSDNVFLDYVHKYVTAFFETRKKRVAFFKEPKL